MHNKQLLATVNFEISRERILTYTCWLAWIWVPETERSAFKSGVA